MDAGSGFPSHELKSHNQADKRNNSDYFVTTAEHLQQRIERTHQHPPGSAKEVVDHLGGAGMFGGKICAGDRITGSRADPPTPLRFHDKRADRFPGRWPL
ncbi:hypothetical protein GCM10007881_08250 [Mesorhizobium huakuii]|nr:hypothetical protein GCM10007881_08250 [Mesorhizobium huakuii]